MMPAPPRRQSQTKTLQEIKQQTNMPSEYQYRHSQLNSNKESSKE